MPKRQNQLAINKITNSSLIILNFVILLNFMPTKSNETQGNATLISRRARCTIDCYAKCVQAEVLKAVYCSCPLQNITKIEPCDTIVNDLNFKDKIIDRDMKAKTFYKDVHTISVQIEPYPDAFIYVFEYSTISSNKAGWIFAGASTSPQIRFSIGDSCRDYQFRTIIVLNLPDLLQKYVVFQPKAIPVKFPQFIVPEESIYLDQPIESIDGNFFHTSISWHNPVGYDDDDIYAYESPIVYPISCVMPNEHLSQPRVELFEGGARMYLNFPIEILQERCRIYMEIKILPKCLRVENSDIQTSIEIDCKKFPNLNYCKKEFSPQCTDIIDLWGRDDGAVVIVWQPLHSIISDNYKNTLKNVSDKNHRKNELKEPLYYSLNFGIMETKGPELLGQKRIIKSQEIIIPGNVTKSEMHNITTSIEYGVQICGIYSTKKTQSPFNIVPAVRFECSKCKNGSMCINCSKLENNPAFKIDGNKLGFRNLQLGGATATTLNGATVVAQELPSTDCFIKDCSTPNRTTYFISSNNASLNVYNPHLTSHNNESKYVGNIKGKSSTVNLFEQALNFEAEDISYNDRVNVFRPVQNYSKIVSTNRHIPLQENTSAITVKLSEPLPNFLFSKSFTTNSPQSTTEFSYTKVFAASSKLFETTKNMATKVSLSLSTVSYPLHHTENLSTTKTLNILSDLILQTTFTTLKPPLAIRFYGNSSSNITKVIEAKKQSLSKSNNLPISRNNKNVLRSKIIDNFAAVGHKTQAVENDSKFTSQSQNNNDSVIGKVLINIQDETNKIQLNETHKSNRSRVRVPSKIASAAKTHVTSCQQKNGIICEFGCLDNFRCECPFDSKRLETNCVRGMVCPAIDDVRAHYQNSSQTVNLFSKQIANFLINSTLYNKMIIEYGELTKIKSTNHSKMFNTNEHNMIYDFKENSDNQHTVISINKLDQSLFMLFEELPFKFVVKERPNVFNKTYGISVCFLNTSLVPIIFDNDISPIDNKKTKHFASIQSNYKMPNGKIDKNTITSYAQTLLNPIEMRHVIALNSFGATDGDVNTQIFSVHKLVVFIGPLFFILGMLVFGVSLLCMSIVRRRKKQHLRRYTSSTLKYRGNTMPRGALLKYNNGSRIMSNMGVARDHLSATIPPNTISGFTAANLTSMQPNHNKNQHPEMHHFAAFGRQQNMDIITEVGNPTITKTIGGGCANYNDLSFIDERDNNSLRHSFNNGVVNRNFYVTDNNLQNRFNVPRNVHF